MHCDIIKTNHQVRAMFISSWAAPWITYEAVTKARERQYELFIIDSEKQIRAIIEKRKLELLIDERA